MPYARDVSEFLTAAWLDALAAVTAAAPPLPAPAADVRLVVQQTVRDAPGGAFSYTVTIDGPRVEVRAGAAPQADLLLTADYATAAALHRGELNAQEAISSGGLVIRGALGRLLAARPVLDRLDDRFAGVRAATTYDHAP